MASKAVQLEAEIRRLRAALERIRTLAEQPMSGDAGELARRLGKIGEIAYDKVD